MKEGSTTFVFDTHARYRRVLVNNWCTSAAVVAAVIILTVASLVFGMLWFWNITMPFSVTGAFMAAVSLDAVLLLMFTYGVTYLPAQSVPHTVSQLLASGASQHNLAQAGEYALIQTLGPYIHKLTPAELSAAVNAILSHSQTAELLQRIQFSPEEVKQAIETHVLPHLTWSLFSPLVLQTVLQVDHDSISVTDVAGALLLHPNARAFIRQRGLTEKEIEFVIWWQNIEHDSARFTRRWWDERNLLSFTGIGLSWVAGYTPFIDLFSRFPTGRVWDTAFGREELVEQLTNVLARQEQGNVLLVGEAGVGRLGVVKELVRRIRQHQSHPELNGKRIVYLHLNELVAQGTSGAGQLNMLTHAFRELERAGNIIAVLDGLSSVLGTEADDKAALGEALTQVFSSQEVKSIVIMSYDDYHSRAKRNDELLHYFEVVHVAPLQSDSTLRLLAMTSEYWKKRTGIYLPYQTLREIVKNTEHILPYVPFPEKAFDVLEEAVVVVQGRGGNIITPEDIQSLVSQKVGVNVGSIQVGEKRHLLELEDRIHKRVVNQHLAVAAVSRAMIRARAGVRVASRPIGTFLFLGPTGVGKTETAKALAEAYFGSEERLKRLDMSEFQGEEGVARLIGSAEFSQGRLTDLVADNPFSVLLLDEFEKADRLVQQLFLPVFDEGFITDAGGRRYSFAHTIIIVTSNAGAEFIRQAVDKRGNVPPDFDNELRDTILKEGVFLPEVLNRFDGVVTFVPLTPEHIRQVAHLMLEKLNRRLDAEHGVTVTITDELVKFLVKIGFDADFGARPMARAIQDTVEYAVAEEIVRGTVRPGQALQLNVVKLRALQTTSAAR